MSQSDAKQQTRILVQTAAAVCDEKKGQDTRILELDPIDSGLSDFFLVTSATNDRQAQAIADEIEYRLKKEFGVLANSVEGRRVGEWILLDYVDFVVHVFLTERRAFYDIERLRKSARPFTPEEFDAELKAALNKKTAAVRKKAAPKTVAKAPVKKAVAKKAPVAKPAVKKAAAKPELKAAPAKKAITKSVPAKKAASVKPATKKAVAKAPAKKAPAKTAPAKVAVKPAAKKAVAVKKAVAKPAVKKAVASKAVAKKAPVKKAPAKKVAAKKKSGK